MAIRVQTRADVNFGNAGAAETATHVRIREADDTVPLVKKHPNTCLLYTSPSPRDS